MFSVRSTSMRQSAARGGLGGSRGAAAALAFLALAACGDDPPAATDTQNDTTPNGRTFVLAARAEAYDARAQRPFVASLASMTFPETAADVAPQPTVDRPVEAIVVPLDLIGIPWSSFAGPANQPVDLPGPWLAEVEALEALIAEAGKPVVLAISPLAAEFDTLAAEARDANGQLVLNTAWQPYCYDPSTDGNPTKYRDQFAGFARWAVERFRPSMVILGQRMNLYETTCGASAYSAITGFVAEAVKRIDASETLTEKPLLLASVDVEDLYGFPAKAGRCQTGTPADCLATRKSLVATLEASGITHLALESYPHRAFPDATQIPADWLSRVATVAAKPTAIAGLGLPAVDLDTAKGVCTRLVASTASTQRAFLDQAIAIADQKDMPLLVWRTLLDLAPSETVAACPCAGDATLCTHLDQLGAKRDERRVQLVAGLASKDGVARSALAIWRGLLP